jgi:hypothetical protein
MTKYINRIYDITTGEISEVEYTKEQTAVIEAELTKSKAIQVTEEKIQADKAAAQAKLAALGLTADDLKALGL